MIKVNLLKERTARTRKIVPAPEVTRTGLLVAVILALAVVAIGAWWLYLDRQISQLSTTRDSLVVENQRLQGLKKQIDEFERMKQEQQSRIEVIQKLKESQTGPVQLMNHLIRSIPGGSPVWLTTLDQKGDRIQIIGYALRGESVPDFMTNLARSGMFKSVDLEIIEEEKDAARFSLVCITAQKPVSE